MVLAPLSAPAASSPAAAQDYNWAAGYHAGAIWFSPMNSGSGSGSDLTLAPGWIVGLQFERWWGSGRAGMRVNGAFTERPLDLPGGDRDIGVWLADAELLLRLMPASRERSFHLFVSAGGGLVQYRLGRGEVLTFDDAGASYPGNDRPQLAATGGLGADIITGWRWDGQPIGIRLEVVDHMTLESPFDRVAGGSFSSIHNVRFVIGAFSGFGALRL